jgi:hypothetical protein
MLRSSIACKVLPFCTITRVLAFLPCLEATLEDPFWNCVEYPLRFFLNLFTGDESSTLHPKLLLGEEKKVHRRPDRVSLGDWGTTVLFLAKNVETLKGLWAIALSWCIMRFLFCHFCGLLCRTFSRNLLRTSQKSCMLWRRSWFTAVCTCSTFEGLLLCLADSYNH